MKTKKKNSFGKRVLSTVLAIATAITGFTFTPVSSNTVEAEAATSYSEMTLGEQIAYNALQYLGYGYADTNAGEANNGSTGLFDCTGLILKAMNEAGIGNVPTYTGAWTDAITSGSLNLTYSGKTFTYVYVNSVAEYNTAVASATGDTIVVLKNGCSTSDITNNANLTPGTIIITDAESGNAAHGQIYLDTVSAPSFSDAASFEAAFNTYMGKVLDTLADTYGDSTLGAHRGLTVDSARLCSYPSYTNNTSYGIVDWGTLDGASTFGAWSTLPNYFLIVNPTLTSATYGVSLGSTKWVIDAASKDYGVRLSNKISGKSDEASSIHLVSIITPGTYYAKVGIKKVSMSDSSTLVSGAVYGLFTSESDANKVASKTYSSASDAEDGVTDNNGEAIKTTSSTKYWSLQSWDSSLGETQTYYIVEAYAPSGYTKDTTVYEITVKGTTDTDGLAATITNIDPTSSTVSVTNDNTVGSYVTVKENETKPVSATKKFSGIASQRITSVTFELLRNGSDTGKTVTLTSSNASGSNWVNSSAFTGLAAYDSSGSAYTYKLKETKVVYTDYWGSSHTVSDETIIKKIFGATVSGNTTITNTFPTTTYTVKKEFEGDTESMVNYIEATVYATYAGTTKTVETVKLTAKNGWSVTLEDLDRYDYEGNDVKYYTQEITVNYTDLDGNSCTASGTSTIKTIFGDLAVTTSSSGTTVTGTLTNDYQTTEHTVKKEFGDTNTENRVNYIVAELYQNNVATGKTVTLNDANDWTATWSNLDKYDSSGKAYSYKAVEVKVDYDDMLGTAHLVTSESVFKTIFTVSHTTSNGVTTITNTFPTTTYTVKKEFEGDTESMVNYIEATVYATYAGTTKTVETVKLTAKNGWSVTLEGLDRYDYEGNAVKYYTQEVTVNYTDKLGNKQTASGTTVIKTLFGDLAVTTSASGTTITGTLTNDYATTEHTVKKAFGNTTTKNRVNYIIAELYQNGEATGLTIQLDSTNNWTYTWEDLDKYDSSGKEYTYTAVEVQVDYDDMYGTSHLLKSESIFKTVFTVVHKTSDGVTTITNTLNQTELPVLKEFKDYGDSFITSVVFQLYDGGTAKSDWTVTVNKNSSWKGTFTGLDKYDYTGKLKTYTSEEYQVTYTNASGKTETLTGKTAIENLFNTTKVTKSDGTVVVTNAPIRLYGGVNVEKVNTENETVKIEGVKYGVYSDASCSTLIEYIYTDASGIARYEVDQTSTDWFKLNSTTKTVYIKEVHTVEPYVLDETVYTVVITGSEVDAEHSTCKVTANSKTIGTKITQFTQDNPEQYGQITIYKYGEVLTGFTEATLSGDGTIVTGYTNGLFTYEYKLMGGATFELYAAEDITNEAGTISYKKDQLVETLTTGSDGTLTFGLPTTEHTLGTLPLGTYYIVETEAPDGQVIPDVHTWTVTLKYKGETVEVSTESKSVYDTLGNAEVSLIKIDNDTKNTLEGAYYGLYAAKDITNSEGTVIVKAGALISVVKTDENGEGTFLNKNGKSIDIPYGSYYIQEIQTRDGYIYSDEKYEFTFTQPGRKTYASGMTNFSTTFTDERMTAFISIEKQDEKYTTAQGDATLEGAVYGLYAKEDIIHPDGKTGTLYKAGDLVAELTTDVNGYAEIDNLYLGKYYVQEITPSEGYLLDTRTYDLTVVSPGPNNKTTTVTAGRNIKVVSDDTVVLEYPIERPFSLIKLTAEDEDDTEWVGIDGAGFTVYLVSKLVYKADGSIDYDASPKTVINADGSTEGFTYTTYTSEGTVDKVGYYESIDIPYGTYIVHESTVPENTKQISDFYVYITNDDTYKNSLNIPIANIEVTQTTRYFLDGPISAKIKIVKKDATTGEEVIISNATFKIYDVDNEEYIGYYKLDDNSKKVWVDTWTTNDEGYTITEEAFKVGTYRIEELTAPYGYYNKEVAEGWTSTFTIDINSGYTFEGNDFYACYDADLDCYILTVVYEDPEVRGTIEVTKSGEVLDSYDTSTGTFQYVEAGLPGAVYTVYAAEDILTPDGQVDEYGNRTTFFLKDEVVGTIVTGDDGTGTLENLPLGEYYIVETTAPTGYLISDEVQYATLEYADQVTKVVFDTDGTENSFYNDRPTYDISIVKYEKNEDGTTNYDTVLAGTGFQFITTTDIVNYKGEVIVNAGTVLANIVTGADGRATVPTEIDLPFGAYQFVETSVPAGYVLDTTPINAVYAYQGQDTPVITVAREQANHYIKIEVSKEDIETYEPVVGAVLELYSVAEDGSLTLYETWTSDGTAYRINRIPAGTYVLHEASAPGYYVCADDVTIIVNAVAEVQSYTLYDDFTKVEFAKVDIETGEPVEGAVLALYTTDENGNKADLVDQWTTTDETHYMERLNKGTYILSELSAPGCYVCADDMTIVVADTPEVQTFTMEDDFTKAEFAKVDIETGEFVTGAVLALYTTGENGNKADLVEEWTTTNEAHYMERLDKGTYILSELYAPGCYVTADDMTVVIADTPVVQTFTMVDDVTKAEIAKVDIETGEYVIGAEMELYKANDDGSKGELVASWTTTAEPYYIERLDKGTYIVHEVSAPDCHVTAEDITIEIVDTPEVQTFTMKDDYTKIQILKVDIETGEPVVGAVIEMYKLNDDGTKGDLVDTWTTDGTAHYMERVDKGDYILVETYAPGYYVSGEFTFTVEDTAEVQTFTMTDDFTKVAIEKVDIETGEPVIDAVLSLYYMNDDGTRGDRIDTWVVEDEPYYIERLEKGDYILVENLAPGYYVTSEEMVITVGDTPEVQTFTMEDDITKLEIRKTDIVTGEEVIGAVLSIYKRNADGTQGDLIATWTTSGEPYYIDRLDKGTYILVEEYAPDQYITAKDIVFLVDDTGEIQVVEMEDDVTKVLISKTDITTDAEVAGATLSIYSVDDNGERTLVETWTSTTRPYYIEGLNKGNYVLVEEYAPGCYVTAQEVEFTVTDTAEVQQVVMVDDFTKVEILKVDAETGEPVVGAVLELYVMNDDGSRGELVDKWTTDGTAHYIERLDKCDYILVETYAPGKYVSGEMTFTVADTDEVQTFTMEDDITKALFAKVDIETGEFVSGAVLALYTTDENGNKADLVEEWTTVPEEYLEGNEGHYIEGLEKGIYILSELYAPGSYVTADDMIVIIGDTPEVQTFTMEDDFTKVEISKTDIVNGEEVEGATLTIYSVDENGERTAVETWTSTSEPHYIERLDKGNYVLVEEYAPGSYVTAHEVEFTATDTAEIQKVNMEDDFTKVEISKTDIVNGEEVEGATLTIYSVDENGERTAVETWTSTSEPHYIERLDKGDYVLVEEYAPTCYVTANEVEFTVEDTGEIQKVEMVDDITKVEISKTDMVDCEEVMGATLTVYKVEDDGTRTLIDTWVTDGTPYTIERLDKGTYVLVEENTPDGYQVAEEVTFEVIDTGEIQKVDMKDARTYGKVVVNKVDENGDPLEGVEFTITNKETGEVVDVLITDENGYAESKELPIDERQTDQSLKLIVYTIQETKTASADYVLDDTVTEFTFKYVDDTTPVVEYAYGATNELQKGRIAVMKKGLAAVGTTTVETVYGDVEKLVYDYIYLPGVEFTIYADEDLTEVVATITTDDDGAAYSDYLPVGTYYVVETFTPAGYVADDTVYTVTITGDDTGNLYVLDVTKDIVNHPCSVTINIYKEGSYLVSTESGYVEETKPLEGVVIGIYAAEDITNYIGDVVITKDTLIAVLVTDENGLATMTETLPAGSYYYKELKALDGYVLDETEHEFSVSYENDNATLDVNKENPLMNYIKSGTLTVNKVDQNGNPLGAGVEFLVTCVDTGETWAIVTNADGIATLEGLAIGAYDENGTWVYYTYTLQETKTLDNYKLDDTVYTWQFTADNTNANAVYQTFTVRNVILGIVDYSMAGGASMLMLALVLVLMAIKKKEEEEEIEAVAEVTETSEI